MHALLADLGHHHVATPLYSYVVVANGTICPRLLVTIVLSIVLFSYG